MSTKEKLITIVIPYYNASKTIEDALMSICIQSLKSQVDVIIVDDASKKSEYDKLVSIVKKFKKYALCTGENNGKRKQEGGSKHENYGRPFDYGRRTGIRKRLC